MFCFRDIRLFPDFDKPYILTNAASSVNFVWKIALKSKEK